MTVQDSLVQANRATSTGGGAVWVSATGELRSSRLLDNTAGATGGGSAVIGSSLLLFGNVLQGNISGQLGGGVYLQGVSQPELRSNLIVKNSAAVQGGGVYAIDGPAVDLWYNTIADNDLSGAGEGVSVAGGSSVVLRGNIVALNRRGVVVSSNSAATLARNDVWNNSQANYAGIAPGATDLSVDPQFVSDALGEYYLSCRRAGRSSDSALLDAGPDMAASVALAALTTCGFNLLDQGLADLGYHYPVFAYSWVPRFYFPYAP